MRKFAAGRKQYFSVFTMGSAEIFTIEIIVAMAQNHPHRRQPASYPPACWTSCLIIRALYEPETRSRAPYAELFRSRRRNVTAKMKKRRSAFANRRISIPPAAPMVQCASLKEATRTITSAPSLIPTSGIRKKAQSGRWRAPHLSVLHHARTERHISEFANRQTHAFQVYLRRKYGHPPSLPICGAHRRSNICLRRTAWW